MPRRTMRRRRARYLRRPRTYSRRRLGRVSKRYYRKKVGFRRQNPIAMRRVQLYHCRKTKFETVTITQGTDTSKLLANSYDSSALGSVQYANLPDESSFSNIFRFYRFNALNVTLEFKYNGSTQPISATADYLGRIYVVKDPMNITNPSTVTEQTILDLGQDQSRIEVLRLKNGRYSKTFKLYTQMSGVVEASGSSPYFIMRKKWWPVSATDIIHNWGYIKWFTDATGQCPTMDIRVIYNYYVSFKGNK